MKQARNTLLCMRRENQSLYVECSAPSDRQMALIVVNL
jgi:hypothetical protein